MSHTLLYRTTPASRPRRSSGGCSAGSASKPGFAASTPGARARRPPPRGPILPPQPGTPTTPAPPRCVRWPS